MIADMIIIKRPNQIVTELFIRGKNSTFLLVLSQSYFAVPKDVKLNCTHFFIIKILKKWDLQQMEFNHSLHIDYKDFIDCYKKCTTKPYCLLVTDATLASDSLSCLRRTLLGRI